MSGLVYFTNKYPVIVNQIEGMDNDQLEKDIRKAGDHFEGRSAAKCFRTRLDMSTFYESFVIVSEKAVEIANTCPLTTRTDKVPLCRGSSWGLIYTTGHSANVHNHWPSLWSYTYCVSACEKCSPLVFPNAQEPLSVIPKTSQMIVFPSWIKHEVPIHNCEHDRIMISGNLNFNIHNTEI